MLVLQNQIAHLEKINERNNNEIVTKYESELREMKKRGEDKVNENQIKINELKENQSMMSETQARKLQFEADMQLWKMQCDKLAKQIQQEKYNNQIDLAKRK